jgi:phosphate transport system substrate-binding protein
MLAGCGPAKSPAEMKNSSERSSGGGLVKLQGSGASFPAPLYARWFKEYSSKSEAVRVDYQAKGSGGGIKDFTEHTVDFGASDAAMNDAEIAAVKEPVVMLPMTAGSIVLSYNLPEVKAPLKLSRDAYSKIFLGKITSWDDPAIAATNEGVTLPKTPITVARRADSSGTTFVFTNHLSAVSAEFKDGPGVGKTVNWPQSDKFIAAPKNDGVTTIIKQTPGAIGYIEYGFAEQSKLPMAVLENKAGKYVEATLENAQTSLASVEMPEDLRAWIPDPDGDSLSNRQLYVVAVLQQVCRCSQGERTQELDQVVSDRRPKAEYRNGICDAAREGRSGGHNQVGRSAVVEEKRALEWQQPMYPQRVQYRPTRRSLSRFGIARFEYRLGLSHGR